MSSNKKKFSFFDLADEGTFANTETVVKQEKKESPISSSSNSINRTVVNQKPNANKIVTSKPVNTNNERLYPKVDEFTMREKKLSSNQISKSGLQTNNIKRDISTNNLMKKVEKKVAPNNNGNIANISSIKHDSDSIRGSVYAMQDKNSIVHQQNVKNSLNISSPIKKQNNNINNLFEVKEKLDVKTNIYIKKWIYDEVERIHSYTNKSRSAVINTLLELALKEIKND